ncbi:ulp1 protease family, C-terminal catalytic domain-containing protein [Tanacetum coccineum]
MKVLLKPKLRQNRKFVHKSNVGKRKRLVEDKEVDDERDSDVEGSDGKSDSDKEDKGTKKADVSNESKEEVKDVKIKDNESEEAEESKEADVSNESKEEVKDVKIKVVKSKKKVVLSKSKKQNKEVEADVEGNESEEADESEEDNESEEAEESKEDKESKVAEEVVKGVKTKVEGNGTKGINKGVVSKAKKWKHVSDSSEEEKVLKPKKVSKKKKQVSESSSSYEDEKPLKNKKKRSKRVKDVKKKTKKPLTAEQIKKIKYFSDYPGLRSRIVPCSLFAAIRDSQVDLESFMSDIGFSSLHNVFIDTLSQRFVRFVVRAFSASSYEFKLDKGIIRVTPEKVYEILGVPLGGTSIFDLPEIPLDDPFVKEWFNAEPKTLNGFYIGLLCFLIELEIQEEVIGKDFNDPVEKISLEDLLKRANAKFPNDEKVIELYEKYRILFKKSVFAEDFQAHLDDFDNNDDDGGGDNVEKKKEFAGEDVVNAKKDGVNDEKDCVNAEKDGVDVFQEGEADVNEEPEDILEEETFTQWIEKISNGLASKICLCDLGLFSRIALCVLRPQRVVTRSSPKKRIVKPSSYLTSPYMNKKTKVIPLIKRHKFVLGNSLFAMQDDNETVFQFCCGHELSSVRLNMETLAPRLWIDANVIDCWLSILNHEELVRDFRMTFETVFHTRSGHDLSSVCLNMETLAPRLWIDANVIDYWTKAIIEGTIDEEQQWKVFSDEISAQFKHDFSSISLSEVNLAFFFPICVSGHFYVVAFHIKKQAAMIILDNSDCGETYSLKYKAVCEPLKKFFARHLKNYNHPKHVFVAKLKHRIPKLKWSITKNHSDCRVFTMIHLKSYVGKPVAQWDVGLCAKSDEQVSQLRRMRFKIATKILLRDLNVQAQKMFDLAFKFETENDEQTRISIIVNAIKNRAERDPAKTKTVDENQEEDALKNKRHG